MEGSRNLAEHHFVIPKECELSEYQIEKLTYYFKFFDADGNGKLEKADLEPIMKRIQEFTGWTKDSVQYKQACEVHECFFEVLFEKADEDSNKEIDLNEWLSMWQRMLPGCMGMSNFPVWLRLLPQTLFGMIDRNEDDVIDEGELALYYEKMCDVPKETAKVQARMAMDQMTDFGEYPLDIDSFEQVFANFLIGRTGFGPGRFLFALFCHRVPNFKLIAPFNEEEEEFRQRKGSGAKKIVRRPRPKLQALR